MSSAFPVRVAGLFLLVFCGCSSSADVVCNHDNQVVVEDGNSVKMVIPDRPYAHGALQIVPTRTISDVAKWSDDAHVETRDMINRVAEVWEKQDVAGYLVYGKNAPDSNFSWQVVPYPKSGLKITKHLNVLWNITFGASCISHDEQKQEAEAILSELVEIKKGNEEIDSSTKEDVSGDDAFCKQDVIDKQLIFDGKDVYVIYNYAPIGFGEEKLHFLVLPKKHRLNFTDLTNDEYVESMQLSQRLVDYYQSKGITTAYIFNKTGKEAGQTVPHWHQHVILAANKTQEFFGKLSVLKKMLFGASPLSDEELNKRVQALRDELSAPLSR